MARVSGALVLLTFSVIVILFLLPSTSATSHYETYMTTVTQSNYQCYPYTYTYCYNWYYWNYWYYGWYWRPYYYWYYWHPWYGYYAWWSPCYYQTAYNCYWSYSTVQQQATRCASGWTGTYCDVPVCNPSCTGGMVCTDVNKCSCQSGGTSCQIVPCSTSNNCYPGTCATGTCKCPAGFNGTNCETITQKPTIGDCAVKLYGTVQGRETVLATANCAAEGLTPLTAWVGFGLDTSQTNYGLVKIEVIWRPNYEFPLSMPPRPTGASSFFVSNAPVNIGIAKASWAVSASTASYECPDVTVNNPKTSVLCDENKKWDDLNINSILRHNASFTVQVSAQLGGHKDGDPTYTYNGDSYGFGSQTILGIPATLRAAFQFDTKPPTHCLLQNDKGNCTVFPIAIDQDITTNPVINPKFLMWTDDGSGIYKYHVEVFILGENGLGSLSEVGSPLKTGDITGDVNNFQFTAGKPGVYSIQLTVSDRANNTAKARKIFNFNDKPSFTTTSMPVYVTEADDKTRNAELSFITQPLSNPSRLHLNWPKRFEENPWYSSIFKMRVEGWPASSNNIDDQYGTTYGRRSIAAVTNLTGIASIGWAAVVDRAQGGFGADVPKDNDNSSWTWSDDTSVTTATIDLDNPIKDGDTVVIWLKAVDVVGNANVTKLRVFVDTSPIQPIKAEFVKKGIDQYTSAVFIDIDEPRSGINSTWYEIRDIWTKVQIFEGYAPATTRDPPHMRKRGIQQPCVASDSTCYCTPFRKCFAKKQVIAIDHCLIDRFSSKTNNKLVVNYKLSNMAGVESSLESIDLEDISSLKCRDTGKLSGGAIAGIVIGCILGFLIIILLIILIITYRRRPEFKQRVDRTVRNVRQTMHWKHRYTDNHETANPVYNNAQPPPPYTAGPSGHYAKNGTTVDVEARGMKGGGKPSSGAIHRSQLRIEQVVDDKGRFATISRAKLDRNGEVTTVAAKVLKNGFSPNDAQLMTSKIAFFKKLPTHGNIVRFIGHIDDEGTGEGPIMLLELCQMSLKDWLGRIHQLSTDDLEAMLGFTLNIARGVQHLHSHKIIHRRLAVRNVMLQQQANGLVAKLIGFGPVADGDDEDDAGGNKGTRVPIKWLAPETLDTLMTSQPTYNDKTDAWSFGVTIWEMYSKNAAPYGNVRSAEIRDHLKRGNRLQCPADCPPEMFASVVQPCWNDRPAKRPKFNAIINAIEDFRRGVSGDQQGYYAADDAARGGSSSNNDAGLYYDDITVR